MDRRQRKTRAAIFQAFTELLSEKSFDKMTVEEIIKRADVGRATFYAHFETREYLLKELCHELFCHIFDAVSPTPSDHRHIFACEEHDSVFLHLIKHLEKNDNHVLKLFAGKNNELFLGYFKRGLRELVKANLSMFARRKSDFLPEDLWITHITSTFVETIRWWIDNGKQESAESVAEYFFGLV
ncbi:MAG: TetR/AcrR family transcriptional regulator [Clostridia bacterium]|nr:TetR/AcrR family transcriptional regulator [Clostridia bacterium]